MENLGKKGKCQISGFEGIVTACCVYYLGAVRYELTHSVTDGGDVKTLWIYDKHLILLS